MQAENGDEGEYLCQTGLTSGGYESKSMYFWLSLLILACSGRSSGDEEREKRREWKGKKRGRCKEMPDNICTVSGERMTDMDKWKLFAV